MRHTIKGLGGNFLCMDCGKDTSENDEYYMLKYEVWAQAVPNYSGMLCLACVEKRLGRAITRNDFLLDVPVNEENAKMCEELRLRLYS